MPASDQHRLYSKNKDKWQLVRDCVEGSEAIKSATGNNLSKEATKLHNVAGSRYLPVPNPNDNSIDNQDRYSAYKQRANFVNFTGHTKDGFTGMIASKPSEIELDSTVEYMNDNADGAGQNLQQLVQRSISEVLEVGRYGLLSDYPTVAEGGTKAQTKAFKSTIKRYPAESIKNWREEVVNGETILTMVSLAETIEVVSVDGFSAEEEIHHRKLFLDEGVYKQQMYDADDDPIGDELTPRKFNGSTWDIIPFQFLGSIDNNSTPDKATLYDIAEINVSHYRNSADFEESSFLVGQPTPVISGLTAAWVKEVLKGGVQVGSRTAILLPSEASADLLQANENQMPSKGMEIKEKQLMQVGAKIITDAGGVETAEAAKIKFAGQNSKLGTVVMNVEKGIENVLDWSMLFMGGKSENIVDINKQFYESTINPQLLIASMQLLDRKVIAVSDIRDSMRKSGALSTERTDELIDAELVNVNPMV